MIRILRKIGVSLTSVAFIPDRTDAIKLSIFLQLYDNSISSLYEIESNFISSVVVDVDDDLQPEMLAWLRRHSIKAFALDWYINDSGIVKGKINLREGVSAFKYCIIREEFHIAKNKYAGIPPSYDAVVVLGGGDFRGHLSTLLKYFKEEVFFSYKKIVVVIGPMIDDSVFNIVGYPKNILVLKSPDNIAELMANACVGISNGGTSLMEFTMLGIPTLIFPQTSKEDIFIKPFLENGSSVLGSLDRDVFKKQLKQLWENHTLRTQMSEKARQLIDGLGAQRIADKIANFAENDK